MKMSVKYNRVERTEYTLSTSDLEQAVRAYITAKLGATYWPPANAREETSLDFGDSHDDAVTFIRRFIYDDEPESTDAVGQRSE
jgi:hypothetical protein